MYSDAILLGYYLCFRNSLTSLICGPLAFFCGRSTPLAEFLIPVL